MDEQFRALVTRNCNIIVLKLHEYGLGSGTKMNENITIEYHNCTDKFDVRTWEVLFNLIKYVRGIHANFKINKHINNRQ
jgi:hypothetical protein